MYDIEDEGIKKIHKSAITAEIHAADKARDSIWFGMKKANLLALNHFDPEVVEAGKRLKILFDTYGNVAHKPLNEQTSAVYNILQELQGKYSEDVKAVNIEDWVAELKARNEDFDKLMKARFDETTMKSDIKVKEARLALDDSYRGIMERLAAMALLEGEAKFEPFIRSLNTVTDKYALILNQRYGKKKAASQLK